MRAQVVVEADPAEAPLAAALRGEAVAPVDAAPARHHQPPPQPGGVRMRHHHMHGRQAAPRAEGVVGALEGAVLLRPDGARGGHADMVEQRVQRIDMARDQRAALIGAVEDDGAVPRAHGIERARRHRQQRRRGRQVGQQAELREGRHQRDARGVQDGGRTGRRRGAGQQVLRLAHQRPQRARVGRDHLEGGQRRRLPRERGRQPRRQVRPAARGLSRALHGRQG
jgi:hypothetical protein